jgi:hypothetical protein
MEIIIRNLKVYGKLGVDDNVPWKTYLKSYEIHFKVKINMRGLKHILYNKNTNMYHSNSLIGGK